MVVRTSYGDETAWSTFQEQALAPSDEGFEAYVEFHSDPTLDGLSVDDVTAQLDPSYEMSFVCVADERAVSEDEHPVVVVNLREKPGSARGRSFRVTTAELWSVENNLSEANMDFDEFADPADAADGVFRGF